MSINKKIACCFAVPLVGITLWSASFFVEGQRHLNALKLHEGENAQRLRVATATLREKSGYLERLRRDPELIEQIVRRKLGYVKADEIVFRFEASQK